MARKESLIMNVDGDVNWIQPPFQIFGVSISFKQAITAVVVGAYVEKGVQEVASLGGLVGVLKVTHKGRLRVRRCEEQHERELRGEVAPVVAGVEVAPVAVLDEVLGSNPANLNPKQQQTHLDEVMKMQEAHIMSQVEGRMAHKLKSHGLAGDTTGETAGGVFAEGPSSRPSSVSSVPPPPPPTPVPEQIELMEGGWESGRENLSVDSVDKGHPIGHPITEQQLRHGTTSRSTGSSTHALMSEQQILNPMSSVCAGSAGSPHETAEAGDDDWIGAPPTPSVGQGMLGAGQHESGSDSMWGHMAGGARGMQGRAVGGGSGESRVRGRGGGRGGRGRGRGIDGVSSTEGVAVGYGGVTGGVTGGAPWGNLSSDMEEATIRSGRRSAEEGDLSIYDASDGSGRPHCGSPFSILPDRHVEQKLESVRRRQQERIAEHHACAAAETRKCQEHAEARKHQEQAVVLRKLLGHALESKDWPQCWARIDVRVRPNAERSGGSSGSGGGNSVQRHSAIVRLLDRNGDFYVFVDNKRGGDGQPVMYLLHTHEFRVDWLGNGVGLDNSSKNGRDLEREWFMHYPEPSSVSAQLVAMEERLTQRFDCARRPTTMVV
jgi:hypothetical protein